MSQLERSLSQHGIKVSGWLLPPSESPVEDPPNVDEPDAGGSPQDQTSSPELLPGKLPGTRAMRRVRALSQSLAAPEGS